MATPLSHSEHISELISAISILEECLNNLSRSERERVRGNVKPIAELEREAIIHALHVFGHSRTKTHKALGISIRNLTNKIRRYRQQGFKIPGAEGK